MAPPAGFSNFSPVELSVIAISEIIQELLKAHNAGVDVNLNKIKTQVASKYGLSSTPKLVDIISAVPLDMRKVLVPKLKAKPIRTASGVGMFSIIYSTSCNNSLVKL